MGKRFAGTMMSPIVRVYPRNSVFEALDQRNEELIRKARAHDAQSVGSQKGGTNKAANQWLARRDAIVLVRDKWLQWQKRQKKPSFRLFWQLEADSLYKELKRTGKTKAAESLRKPSKRKRRNLEFVTAEVVLRNMRKLKADPASAQRNNV